MNSDKVNEGIKQQQYFCGFKTFQNNNSKYRGVNGMKYSEFLARPVKVTICVKTVIGKS